MEYNKSIFLCAAKRTAIGSLQGGLSEQSAPDLASVLVKAVIEETKIPSDEIDQILLGCVLTGGVGQAPARQAALKGGLSVSVNALTINKVCSSGLKAIALGANEIELGAAHAVLAGGMESMTQAPYILPKLRVGAKLGNVSAEDTIVKDGLWDVYNNVHMGSCAEILARKFSIKREEQDEYALQSYDRAAAAMKEGRFASQIVSVPTKTGEFKVDEEVEKLRRDKMPQLKPVFEKDGGVTAANASSISDGAALTLLCSEEFVRRHNLKPLARIVAHNTHSQEPELFGIAPVEAVRKVLKEVGKQVGDINLFEINEAFSAVAIACQRELGISAAKLNVNGGAVALGHPIGASGARILVTLVHELIRMGGKTGVAAICNGGGEATALYVEV